MKVFVYSARPYDQPALQAASGKHELLFTEKRLNEETFHFATGCQAVSIFTSDDASATVLEKLHACGIRYVSLRSVGYDHIDLDKAALLGMHVENVPEYSPYSVAEHAVAMLMAVNRKPIEGQQLMQLQDFRIDSLKGFDIHSKTAGVIGTGKIGMAFARIMIGFGAKVLACDPKINQGAIDLGIKYVSLKDLLKGSDIVSLHCPLTSDTRHLIANAEFNWMKKGSILINSSRGPVINTTDLIAALKSGRLGAACLDVYEFEKGLFFNDHRNDIIHDEVFTQLRSFKNVLITGHQGFLTTDAIKEIAETTIRNLDCWQNGIRSLNELTSNVDDDEVNARPDHTTVLSL
ncbi:MAG: 2-hydroxyacid dehydrogenase [Cyclobacteriaceae bacterium]